MRVAATVSMALLLGASQAARAEAPPLWEAGLAVGGISQPAYPGAPGTVDRALVLPFFIYRGPLLRAGREGLDLRALHTDTLELDLGFSARLGAKSSETPLRAGMSRIGTTLEVGPRLRWTLASCATGKLRLDLPLRAVFDASDSMHRVGMSFEPTLRQDLRLGDWGLSLGLGALLGDRSLSRYYYGVRADEATAQRPAYEAKSGLHAWRLNAALGRELSSTVRVYGFTRLDDLSGAANRDSPLVARRDGWTVGIGLTWTPWRSAALAQE
jgi:outer membrane scaffolding protein for murein synthesis (MipA/OmpV family)